MGLALRSDLNSDVGSSISHLRSCQRLDEAHFFDLKVFVDILHQKLLDSVLRLQLFDLNLGQVSDNYLVRAELANDIVPGPICLGHSLDWVVILLDRAGPLPEND